MRSTGPPRGIRGESPRGQCRRDRAARPRLLAENVWKGDAHRRRVRPRTEAGRTIVNRPAVGPRRRDGLDDAVRLPTAHEEAAVDRAGHAVVVGSGAATRGAGRRTSIVALESRLKLGLRAPVVYDVRPVCDLHRELDRIVARLVRGREEPVVAAVRIRGLRERPEVAVVRSASPRSRRGSGCRPIRDPPRQPVREQDDGWDGGAVGARRAAGDDDVAVPLAHRDAADAGTRR